MARTAQQVTITSNGEDRPVQVTVLAPGYGSASALSMIPQGWVSQAGSTYHVAIGGITPAIEYDVEFVDCG